MAIRYQFGGMTFFVARAKSGYVTRAYLASPGKESEARAKADGAAEEIERQVHRQLPVHPDLLAQVSGDALIPANCRVVILQPKPRHPAHLVELDDELVRGKVWAGEHEAVSYSNSLVTPPESSLGLG
jgi:hypothetical protein